MRHLRICAFLFLALFPIHVALGQGKPDSKSTASSATAKRITVKIYLQSDPTIQNGEYVTYNLDPSPKVFVADFSAPVNPSSAQAAFLALNKKLARDDQRLLQFEWPSEKRCLIHLNPVGIKYIEIGFNGAKGLHGGAVSDIDNVEGYKSQLHVEIFPARQVLRKMSFDGRILKEFPITNEPLYFAWIFKNEDYAVAYRLMNGEEWNLLIPYLLSLADHDVTRFPLERPKDLIFSLQQDPKTKDIVLEEQGKFTAYSIDSIVNRQPGKVLFDLKLNKDEVSTDLKPEFSPDGEKIAVFLPLTNSDDYGATCTLAILNRRGKKLNQITLPARLHWHEGALASPRVEWEDADHLLLNVDELFFPVELKGVESIQYRISLTNQHIEKTGQTAWFNDKPLGSYRFVAPLAELNDPTTHYFNVLDRATGKVIVDHAKLKLDDVHQLGPNKFLVQTSKEYEEHKRLFMLDLPAGSLSPFADGRVIQVNKDSVWVADDPF